MTKNRRTAGKSGKPAPEDVVLAPQTEPPRHARGIDRSRPKSPIVELQWADFDRMVQSLAKSIGKGFDPEAVVGVAHGGVFVGGAVASALGCEFYPVRISRRSRDKAAGRAAYGQMPKELKGRRVVIVDDVAASGDTLQLACKLVAGVGAKEARTAALIQREHGFAPDWAALVTESLVVFPWDYSELTEDRRFEVDPDKAGA